MSRERKYSKGEKNKPIPPDLLFKTHLLHCNIIMHKLKSQKNRFHSTCRHPDHAPKGKKRRLSLTLEVGQAILISSPLTAKMPSGINRASRANGTGFLPKHRHARCCEIPQTNRKPRGTSARAPALRRSRRQLSTPQSIRGDMMSALISPGLITWRAQEAQRTDFTTGR